VYSVHCFINYLVCINNTEEGGFNRVSVLLHALQSKQVCCRDI